MGQINVGTTTVRKKNPSKPQKRIEVRKVVINNQMQRLHRDAKDKKRP